MSYYRGEIVNLSLQNVSILRKFKVVDIKRRFCGLIKIYTIEFPDEKIEEIVKCLQANMSTKLKKEWYITLYNKKRVIIVFRSRIFDLSGVGITPVHGEMLDISSAEDKANWNEMINYAKSLGIPDSQCDFLPEDFQRKYM